MLEIIEVASVQATTPKTSPRTVPAHVAITGSYGKRGFTCGFVEITQAYLYVRGELSDVAQLPPNGVMASALRSYYREIQNAQLAQLNEQNRADMAKEISKTGAAAYVPKHNTHGVDAALSRMEAEVHSELQENAQAQTSDDKGKRKGKR